MKAGGRQSSRLAEISDSVGDRREMENRSSILVGSPVELNDQYSLAVVHNQANE